MTETVPADIAAAIDSLDQEAYRAGGQWDANVTQARAALDAVILKHLRAYAEMKAALERIEQGV